jgi:hypothetical protein
VESDEEFIALCIIILIMFAIAALMDIIKKPKKSDSADVEITIKIKCDNEKTSSEEAHSNAVLKNG